MNIYQYQIIMCLEKVIEDEKNNPDATFPLMIYEIENCIEYVKKLKIG